MISKPHHVRSSIANKPGATWKECVQAKVILCVPKFAKMKWGYMDAQNRYRVHELLKQGQVQRNVGRQTGVNCTYLQPQVELAGVSAEPDDEEEPNWGSLFPSPLLLFFLFLLLLFIYVFLYFR